MAGSIIWKSALALTILVWAILNIIPVQDSPFDSFILSQATAELEEFNHLHERAITRVSTGEANSFFIAFRDILKNEKIDLQKFFPEINARDIRNLEKRNQVLLDELRLRSKGKVKPGLDLKGGVSVTYKVKDTEDSEINLGVGEREELTASEKEFFREAELNKAVEILRKRVDGFGVAEPVIRLIGDKHIEVQLPGLELSKDPGIVADIGKPALLVFSLVHRTTIPSLEHDPPIGYRAMFELREDRKTGQITQTPYYIKKIPEMEGDIIDEAFAAPTEFGSYRVLLRFTSDGEEAFASATRRIAEENERTQTVGQLAIILDGELYSAPTVREEIRGGAEISGQFTQREAQELSNVLNNPLKIGLEVDELNDIGPTMAADARDSSFTAFQIGASVVIGFMLLYYVSAGMIAVISVVINIVIVFGTLSSFGATITLPGVAALVLTLGMAVDANILIFERIREELKEGKTLPAALVSGYDKALSTIVDANVTTLITASILIWLGSGPVRGFGVTLAIGIISSIFCALIVSRALLELIINTGFVKRMMKTSLFRIEGVSFLSYRKIAFQSSWVIVLIGIGAIAVNWDHIFGIDFLGGDELTVNFETKLTSQEIDAVAQNNDLGEINTLSQTSLGQAKETLKIQTEGKRGGEVFQALENAFPDAGLELLGKSEISPSVGNEIKIGAVLSVILALLAILVYVALRFEIGYGIGAVIATVHDIFMSIGLYVLLGMGGIGSGQFTAPMVAAVLMIIGYSLNDTIVVFDRIREELTLNPGARLERIVNVAINRTLARTILTSITTLLATCPLFLFGAGVVVDFALVFIIGIFTGTFSSIFIASPVFFWWHKGDRRHVEERGDMLPKYEWETSKKTVT